MSFKVGGTQSLPQFRCKAEEADTRVWLHALKSEGSRKLVCSPDTDVYHIGLPLVSDQSCEVYVCISMFSSQENRFLNLKSLCSAVGDDPDLACIPKDILPKLLQMLFIFTGCDYIFLFRLW